MFSPAGIFLCNHARFKIVQSLFCGRFYVPSLVFMHDAWLIGASEASPFLVMNVAILSVCVCVMDRHDICFLYS